ncbi:MAG TPA: thiamine diphosphokinase [Candidatus Kapabacteria bacterium]
MMEQDAAFVLLGGTINEFPAHIERACSVVAADSGADTARARGIPLTAIVGDLDSVSPETLRHYEAQVPPCEIVHIAEQETNDFEKALRYLSDRWSGEVRIWGMTGGRFDHTISNFSVMLRYRDRFESLVAIDSFGSHSFLTSVHHSVEIHRPIGTTVSLMPFGEATGIVTTGFRYPLSGESLRLGEREGLSNVVVASPASISIEGGALLVSALP